jgi:hypothetical protein
VAKPQQYRDEAAKLRAEAARLPYGPSKPMMLEIAEMYERLADHAEKLAGMLISHGTGLRAPIGVGLFHPPPT